MYINRTAGERKAWNHIWRDGATGWLFTSVYAADPDARFNAYVLDSGNGKGTTPYYNTTNRWVVAGKDYEHPELVIKFANIIRDISSNK